MLKLLILNILKQSSIRVNIVQGMIPSPSGFGPWAEHSLG